MKPRPTVHFLFLPLLLFIMVASCSKEPGDSDPSCTVAGYERIPIPGVNPQAQISAVPSQFFCTNAGPYLHVVNAGAQSSTVLKYRGGTGNEAWLSHPGETLLFSISPSKPLTEGKDELSYFWTPKDQRYEYGYGMANLGNSNPSYRYRLNGRVDPTQPLAFDYIYPTNGGLMRLWASYNNEIWSERRSPYTIYRLGNVPAGYKILGGYADLEDNDTIWVYTNTKDLFQTGIRYFGARAWNLAYLGEGQVNAIVKASGTIYVQYGKYVLKHEGARFQVIDTLDIDPFISWPVIASNGKTVFASNGTYYDTTANRWRSFLGTCAELYADNEKYREVKAFFQRGLPIAATQGSGPVYLLAGSEMIKIHPVF